MTSTASQSDEYSCFINERDRRFARLLHNPEFWKAAQESLGGDILSDDALAHYQDFVFVFNLKHKYRQKIEAMARLNPWGWSEKDIDYMLVRIMYMRLRWESGGMRLSYETYAPVLQTMLYKGEQGEALTPEERRILALNAHMRISTHLRLHPVQAQVLKEEFGNLSPAERRQKWEAWVLDAIEKSLAS